MNKIKQFAAQKQKEGYNEDGLYKVVGDYITSITDDFLKNFIEEYTFYTLNQDDLGSEILQYIAPNKQYGADVTSYEDLLNLITKQKKVEQLLSPSNEDEEWIEQKLNFLKYQGII